MTTAARPQVPSYVQLKAKPELVPHLVTLYEQLDSEIKKREAQREALKEVLKQWLGLNGDRDSTGRAYVSDDLGNVLVLSERSTGDRYDLVTCAQEDLPLLAAAAVAGLLKVDGKGVEKAKQNAGWADKLYRSYRDPGGSTTVLSIERSR